MGSYCLGKSKQKNISNQTEATGAPKIDLQTPMRRTPQVEAVSETESEQNRYNRVSVGRVAVYVGEFWWLLHLLLFFFNSQSWLTKYV